MWPGGRGGGCGGSGPSSYSQNKRRYDESDRRPFSGGGKGGGSCGGGGKGGGSYSGKGSSNRNVDGSRGFYGGGKGGGGPMAGRGGSRGGSSMDAGGASHSGANPLHELDSAAIDVSLVVDAHNEHGNVINSALQGLWAERLLLSFKLDAHLRSGGEAANAELARREESSGGLWARDALKAFAQPNMWPALTTLHLHGLPLVTSTSLNPIGGLIHLRSLRIEDSPQLPTDAARELQELKYLELVSFNGCRSIDNQAVGYAIVMTELISLHLDDTQCNDVAVLIASVFPKLVRLSMRRTGVSDHGVRVLSRRTSLCELSLSGCQEITDEGVSQLSSQQSSTFRSLQRLDISDCPQITSAAVLPHCRINEPPIPPPQPLRTIGTNGQSLAPSPSQQQQLVSGSATLSPPHAQPPAAANGGAPQYRSLSAAQQACACAAALVQPSYASLGAAALADPWGPQPDVSPVWAPPESDGQSPERDPRLKQAGGPSYRSLGAGPAIGQGLPAPSYRSLDGGSASYRSLDGGSGAFGGLPGMEPSYRSCGGSMEPQHGFGGGGGGAQPAIGGGAPAIGANLFSPAIGSTPWAPFGAPFQQQQQQQQQQQPMQMQQQQPFGMQQQQMMMAMQQQQQQNMPMQQWPGEDDSGNLSLQSLAEKMSSQGVS